MVSSPLDREAKEIPSEEMEFLTVDAPQDCIHLIRSMEQDGSPGLRMPGELLASLNGGCSAGDRVADISIRGGTCIPASSPARRRSCSATSATVDSPRSGTT